MKIQGKSDKEYIEWVVPVSSRQSLRSLFLFLSDIPVASPVAIASHDEPDGAANDSDVLPEAEGKDNEPDGAGHHSELLPKAEGS